MLRRAWFSLVLLVAFVAPGAMAQAPSVSMALSPSETTQPANASFSVNVSLSNPGLAPIVVDLSASGNASVTFSSTRVAILPSTNQSVLATVGLAPAHVGDNFVTFIAQPQGGSPATARLTIHVLPAPTNGTTNATQPPPTNSTGGNRTATNGTEPSGNATGSLPPPATNQSQQEPPPATNESATNDTIPPSADQYGHPDPPTPAPQEPAPGGEAPQAGTPTPPTPDPELRVEPALLVLAPRGSGLVRVVETTLVPITLEVPVGFRATLLSSAAGSYQFRVDALPGALENVTLEGRAVAGHASAALGLRVEGDARVEAMTLVPDSAPPPSFSSWAIVAAAVGGSALLVGLVRRRWPFALAILYSRLSPARLLQHPARRRMMDAIRAEPGIPTRELQRRLGLAHGTFTHHLHKLVDGGHVRAQEDGQLRRLHVVGEALAPGVAPLPERVQALLRERGPMRAAALADALGVSRQALHYHLKRLAVAGALRGRTEKGELVVEAVAR